MTPLVLALASPALYLFERDDTKHGDEPADPHTLASSSSEGEDDAPNPRSLPGTSSETDDDGDVT